MTARAFALTFALAASIVAAGAGLARADDGQGGLRAVGRVHSAEPGASLSIAGDTGYGYTGDVLDANDTHHRVLGGLALAARPIPWLELGLSLDGRYDKHMGDEPDDGWVGDPRVSAMAGGKIASGTWLAARVGAWFPGGNAPSVQLDATTVDLAVALTWTRGAIALTATGGYRIDNSAKSVPPMLTRPDRLGVGVSEYDAVLAGVSVTGRGGPWEVFGEGSWDILMGSGAPTALESPMHVGAGVRRALGGSLRFEALAEVSPSKRPDPWLLTLIDIEPRFAATVGFSWRSRPPAKAVVIPDLGDKGDDKDKIVEPPPPPPPTTGGVHGHVVEGDGTPVDRATVALGGRTVETDAQGAWSAADLPAGPLEVAVTADGHDPAKQTVTIVAGADAELEVTVAKVAPPAQIRGVIRSFDGKPLAAKIRIEPLGTELTAGADGTFSVDVAPGSYDVVVEIPGYQTQKRPVKVEAEGVSILNVELRKKRP